MHVCIIKKGEKINFLVYKRPFLKDNSNLIMFFYLIEFRYNLNKTN
jgi:hypothetical protein